MVFRPKAEKELSVGEYVERKRELGERNEVVKVPIARLTRGKKSGRQPKYTPTRMMNEVNKYFQKCEDTDDVPSIKGLMLHLKMYRTQFYRLAADARYMDVLEQARLVIQEWCEKDVYNTRGMAAGKIAYMKNVHSWAEKLEQNSTVQTIDLTPEMARAKIEALAPKLLEVLRNQNVLNQLVVSEQPKVIDVEDK